jgi:CHAT domain
MLEELDRLITVDVDIKGAVRCTDVHTDAHRESMLRLDGLDYRLVRIFTRWMAERSQPWDVDEVIAFGGLLHRCLLDRIWPWLAGQLWADPAAPTNLVLRFASGRELAETVAVPWEYLYPPPAGRYPGFLAGRPDVVLSRFAPNVSGITFAPEDLLTILPVVAQPEDDDRLDPVDAAEVLSIMGELGPETGFRALPTVWNPTYAQLRTAVAKQRPRVLHFMGHSSFDADVGRGMVALQSADGGTDSVDEYRFATALCETAAPRIVVLHSCEGGRQDFSERFAGLAPELLSRGVQYVVAMQYPILNTTAKAFSTRLYRELAARASFGRAVQTCRRALADTDDGDPRLIGMPMLYLSSAAPLLRGTP